MHSFFRHIAGLLLLMGACSTGAWAQSAPETPAATPGTGVVLWIYRPLMSTGEKCAVQLTINQRPAFTIATGEAVRLNFDSPQAISIVGTTTECAFKANDNVAFDTKRGEEYFVEVSMGGHLLVQRERGKAERPLKRCTLVEPGMHAPKPSAQASATPATTTRPKPGAQKTSDNEPADDETQPVPGNGLLVTEDGMLLTSYRAVRNAGKLLVKGLAPDTNVVYPARRLAIDPNNDLALLQIDSRPPVTDSLPFSLFQGKLEIGEELTVIGTGKMPTRLGMISSRSGQDGIVTAFEATLRAPADTLQPKWRPTMGSPVFDHEGNLLGITDTRRRSRSGKWYVLKPYYVRALFEVAKVKAPILRPRTALRNLPPDEQTKRLSAYVCRVIAKP